MRVGVLVCVWECVYVCVFVCMYVYVCECVCVCVYVYMCVYVCVSSESETDILNIDKHKDLYPPIYMHGHTKTAHWRSQSWIEENSLQKQFLSGCDT